MRPQKGATLWANPGFVIKNGSAGTGMVPLIGAAITEEEAWYVITYERTFEGK